MNRIDCFAFTVSYIFRQKKWTVYRQKYPVMFVSINKMELSESWSNPHKSWWMALGFMSATDRMNKKSDSKKKKKIFVTVNQFIQSFFWLISSTLCVWKYIHLWMYDSIWFLIHQLLIRINIYTKKRVVYFSQQKKIWLNSIFFREVVFFWS